MKLQERIVVLDESPLNRDRDLSWDDFLSFGRITCYSHTQEKQIVSRCRKASMILTNKVSLREEVLRKLPKLRYIGVLATGHEIIDKEAVKKRNITVTNVPAYSTASVSQCVFAHLFTHLMGIEKHTDSIKQGMWSKGKDFAYWLFPLQEMADLTMGLVGFGETGQFTAGVARSFGMNVIAYTPSGHSKGTCVKMMASLKELCQKSDVISLHCPLIPQTHRMANRFFFNEMKPEAILINTSRGGLVDEEDLHLALIHRRIKGAALDVLTIEPPPKNHPLLHLPKKASLLTLSPHFAWASFSARKRLLKLAFNNIHAFLKGETQNKIS